VEPDTLRSASEADVVAELEPRDSFGELSLIYNTFREATFKAVEDSEVYVISRKHFKAHFNRRGPRFKDYCALLDEVPALWPLLRAEPFGLSSSDRRTELCFAQMAFKALSIGLVVLLPAMGAPVNATCMSGNEEQLDTCGKECLHSAARGSCVTGCLQRLTLPKSCAECLGTKFDCGVQFCKSDCVASTQSCSSCIDSLCTACSQALDRSMLKLIAVHAESGIQPANSLPAWHSEDSMIQKLENLRLELGEVIKQEVGEVKQEVGEVKQEVGEVKRVQEVQGKALPMMAQQLYRFRAATHSTFDPGFESKCQTYYKTTSCMILGQLFPTCLQDWGKDYYFGPHYFLPVGEHIYKKSMEKEGKDLGIETRHPRNGLLLVKALESQFQDGHMVLIPVEAAGEQLCSDAGTLSDVPEPETPVTLQIHVATCLHHEPVMWWDKKDKSIEPAPFERPVTEEPKGTGKNKKSKGKKKALRTQPITFGDLHLRNIVIRKPFMASLYMQVEFAHEIHRELPDPQDEDVRDKFFDICCDGMKILMQRLCREVEPKRVLPEEAAFAGVPAIGSTCVFRLQCLPRGRAGRWELACNALGLFTFRPGERIIHQGLQRKSALWYIVFSGSCVVSASHTGPDGQETTEVISTLRRPGHFGERSLLRGGEHAIPEVSVDAGKEGLVCLAFEGQAIRVLLEELSIQGAFGDGAEALLPNVNSLSSIEYELAKLGRMRRQRVQTEEIDMMSLNKVCHLGRGGFADVYLMEDSVSQKRYAMKCISKGHVEKFEAVRQVCWEREMLMTVDSPFVIRLVRTHKDAEFLYILLEAALGGTLYKLMRQKPEVFCDDEPRGSSSAFFVACIIAALEHLHDSSPLGHLKMASSSKKHRHGSSASAAILPSITSVSAPCSVAVMGAEGLSPLLLEHLGESAASSLQSAGFSCDSDVAGLTVGELQSICTDISDESASAALAVARLRRRPAAAPTSVPVEASQLPAAPLPMGGPAVAFKPCGMKSAVIAPSKQAVIDEFWQLYCQLGRQGLRFSPLLLSQPESARLSFVASFASTEEATLRQHRNTWARWCRFAEGYLPPPVHVREPTLDATNAFLQDQSTRGPTVARNL
ncbi:Prkg2, partial [Symbiodinium microadriaticum]